MVSMLPFKVNILTVIKGKIAYMNTLGDRIKHARLAAKMSQARLGELCRVSRSAVTQWETGKSKTLKPENLLCVADKTGVSLRWLITGKGEERKSTLKKDLSLFAQSSPTSQQLAEAITELSAKNLLSDEVIAAAHSLILASIPDVDRDTEDADFKPRSGEKISEMMKEKLAHGSVNAKR